MFSHIPMIFTSMASRRPACFPITSFLLSLLLVSGIVGCGGDEKPAADKPKAGTAKPGSDTSAAAIPDGQPLPADKAFSLKLQPRTGDVYCYRITQKGSNEIDGQRATEEATYWFTQKVTGVNTDGSFTIEMRYDSITSKKVLPAGVVDTVATTLAYDTRRKIDSTIPDAAQAKALIGQRVNLTISKGGEVREVSNLDPVLTAFLGDKRDSLRPEQLERLREGIKLTVFQAIVQQLFLQSPPDSMVHAGSSWSRGDSVPLVTSIAAVPSRAKVSYRLAEATSSGDKTIGHVVMSLVTQFPQKKMENPQVTTTINDAKATGTGDLLVDLATGFPIRKSTRIDIMLKVTGKAKVGPAAGKSQSVAQTRSTVTTVDLISHKPAAQ